MISFIKHTTKTYNERIRWWNWDSVEKLESPKKMVTWPQVLVDRTQHPPFLNCFPYFHGLEICKTAIICRFLIAQVDWYVDMYIEIPFSDCIRRISPSGGRRQNFISRLMQSENGISIYISVDLYNQKTAYYCCFTYF